MSEEAEEAAGGGTRDNVAEKVHAQDDAAGGDRERAEAEGELEFGEGEGERRDGGEGGNGMAGREAELIRGKERAPAVGLDVAGAAAARGAFGPKENDDAEGDGERAGGGRDETRFATEEDRGEAEEDPKPTVAAARGANHPEANPLGSAPAVHAMHQAMVARFDEVLDLGQNAHDARFSTTGMKP